MEGRSLIRAGGRQDLHLSRDHEEDEAYEDPRNEDMSEISVLVARDIAEAQDVKLLLDPSTSGIHWEQDWPSDEASNRADGDGYLDVAEEEVRVERVVL